MTTTVFDPTLHPRHLTGTFAPKIMSEPEIEILEEDAHAHESCRSEFGADAPLVTTDFRGGPGRGIPSPGKYSYRIFGAARFGPVFATCLHPEASSRWVAKVVLAGSDTNWVHTPDERQSAGTTIA